MTNVRVLLYYKLCKDLDLRAYFMVRIISLEIRINFELKRDKFLLFTNDLRIQASAYLPDL